MFLGTFSTRRKGEDAIFKRHPRSMVSQVSSSKTLAGAEKIAKKWKKGNKRKVFIFEALDREKKFCVYV